MYIYMYSLKLTVNCFKGFTFYIQFLFSRISDGQNRKFGINLYNLELLY